MVFGSTQRKLQQLFPTDALQVPVLHRDHVKKLPSKLIQHAMIFRAHPSGLSSGKAKTFCTCSVPKYCAPVRRDEDLNKQPSASPGLLFLRRASSSRTIPAGYASHGFCLARYVTAAHNDIFFRRNAIAPRPCDKPCIRSWTTVPLFATVQTQSGLVDPRCRLLVYSSVGMRLGGGRIVT